MPMRVEARLDDAVADGVEAWWDDVETAAHQALARFPLLKSISPYGDVAVPVDRLNELADECEELARDARTEASAILLKIADLARRTVDGEFAELRFNGG